jgi:hypothetical protein
MFFQKKSTKIIAALLVLGMMVVTMMPATADQPFITYGYDWWDDTYPIQSGYVVERIVTAEDLGLRNAFRRPEDVFIFNNPSPEGVVIIPSGDFFYDSGDWSLEERNERRVSGLFRNGEGVSGYRFTEPLMFVVDTGLNRIIISTVDMRIISVLETFFYREDYRVQNFIGDEVDDDGELTDESREEYWAEVNRVFELDQDNNFVSGKTTTMTDPKGIFVTYYHGEVRLYIADHNGGHVQDNGRVIAADLSGGIWMEYHRPESETFVDEEGRPASFNPSKVLSDNAGNVYVAVPTISRGAVTFSEDGVFRGYFGANRVAQTAEAVLNYFLRFILPRDVMNQRLTAVPVVFSNFDIDEDQFIYTVTETRATGVDIVNKLNPAGDNIFSGTAYDDVTWGAANNPYVMNTEYVSLMTDISVDDIGNIFLLDRASGQVFQYDKEGHLLFIFGGLGNQQGTFHLPVAIETFDNKVYVLDQTKGTITVFGLTEFGALVAEAMELFEIGDYSASRGPWEEVMRRDANYFMANVGMGNALLSDGYFEEALGYFYRHSDTGYERAFRDFRTIYIRDNFNLFVGLALGLVVLLIVVSIVSKRRKKAKKS